MSEPLLKRVTAPLSQQSSSALYLIVAALVMGGAGYVLGRVHQLDADRASAEEAARDAGNYLKTSYSQYGEDMIVSDILSYLNITEVRYLDVGAWDPIKDSNTYMFYLRGHRGVLVEPNDEYVRKIRATRPGDVVLDVGVGVTDQAEADYYKVTGHPGLNTFSKEVADKHRSDGKEITPTKKRLVNINKVIADNFKTPPNFISIDIEGLDLDILKTLDFDKYRPAVICVETLKVGTQACDTRIEEFLRSKNYSIRGATFVNTIFVADELVTNK
jgi:FkbM family methyltransferase